MTIFGKVITDQFMGEFHRQGLAKEFDMRDSVKKTIQWKKGQAPKVIEGWKSEIRGVNEMPLSRNFDVLALTTSQATVDMAHIVK